MKIRIDDLFIEFEVPINGLYSSVKQLGIVSSGMQILYQIT